MAKISVCIPVYNGAEYIQHTIFSVLNQTFTDFELLVFDNCSTDNTVQIVKEFEKKDSRIRLIENEKNYGMIGNFNRCLEIPTCDFIQILNADDNLVPACLEEKFNLISSDEEIVFVFSASNVINGVGKNLMTRKPFGRTCVFDGKKILKKSFRSHNLFGEPSNILMRKNAVLEAGKFSPECIYSPDWEYWLRLCLQGKVGYIAKPLMEFRVSEIGTSGKYLNEKERLRIDEENLINSICSMEGIEITKSDVFVHKIKVKMRTFVKRFFYRIKK